MVIFLDIDETLLNQKRAEAAAAGPFLVEYAHVLPDGMTRAELCQRWRALRERHLPEFLRGAVSYAEHHRRRMRDLFLDGPVLSDRDADERYARFLAGYEAAWSLFGDVLPCLEALSGLTLGILSNGSGAQQRRKLQRTGILDRFSVIVLSEEIGSGKPAPEIFAAACAMAGCRAPDCVYIGDRLGADARASAAAGMRGIWLDRTASGTPRGVQTIHSLRQLPALLGAPVRGDLRRQKLRLPAEGVG